MQIILDTMHMQFDVDQKFGTFGILKNWLLFDKITMHSRPFLLNRHQTECLQ